MALFGNIGGSALSSVDMPRLRLLVWCVWVWWFPTSVAAWTLAVEPSNDRGALALADQEGRALSLTTVVVRSVVDGPWVTTELDLGYRGGSEHATLSIALPLGAQPLARSFTPKFEHVEGNRWEMDLDSYAEHVTIAYVQESTQPRSVLVPLTEHAQVEYLSVQVTNQQGQPLVESLQVSGGNINGDVVLWSSESEAAVRAKDLAAIPVRVPGAREPNPLADTAYLVDTSASVHRVFERQLEVTRELLARSSGQVAVIAFDADVETIYLGSATGVGSSVFERLRNRGALGATDLGNGLRAVSGLVQKWPFRRVVLVSDGAATLGEKRPFRLTALVDAWSGRGIRRLDAVVLRTTDDTAFLRELTTAGLPERGVVVAAPESFEQLPRLERRTVSDQSVTVVGATSQAPRIIRGAEPGDLVWIHARVPTNRPLAVQVAGMPERPWAPREVYYPLLARVFPWKGIGAPPRTLPGTFGEYLEIRAGKVEVMASHTRPPIVRCGCLTYVSGRLPPEAIQRTLRLNYGRFRGCYAQALLSNPTLAGRVVVRFVIGPVGHVTSVRDEGSTLANRSTTQCIMEAFSRIEFPIPEGGSITVVYPLLLTPDGSVEPDTTPETDGSKATTPVELANPEYPLLPRDVGEEAFYGDFAAEMTALRERRWSDAERALHAFERQPNQDLISTLARGRFAEAQGDLPLARRTYGSMLDLYPRRSEVRRFVVAHWFHSGDLTARLLSGSPLAVADSGLNQRQLAWTMVKRGDYRRALPLLVNALQRSAKESHDDLSALLRQDVGMVARAELTRAPSNQTEVFAQLRRVDVQLPTEALLRFVLLPEQGEGLSLGLYPEPSKGRVRGTDRWLGRHQVFSVANQQRQAPYRIHVRHLPDRANSTDSVAFGYVEIVEQDSRGVIQVDLRPFVFQTSRSEVDLGPYGGG